MYEGAIAILEESLGTPIEDPDALRNLAIETLQRLDKAEIALRNAYSALEANSVLDVSSPTAFMAWQKCRDSISEIEELLPTVKQMSNVGG